MMTIRRKTRRQSGAATIETFSIVNCHDAVPERTIGRCLFVEGMLEDRAAKAATNQNLTGI